MKKLPFRPAALIAMGVFLGRAAQADTVLDFQVVPAGQPVNIAPGILQNFGDTATNSSDGVAVTGFGTPNINLSWRAAGGGEGRWDFYHDGGFWDVAQLNDSVVGGVHSVIFAPNSASARAVIKSFNFFPYYDSAERFTYQVSVVADGAVVSGPTLVTFISNALKNHPVSVNYTGAPGQTLKMRIARVASTLTGNEVEGGSFNIAVDDIAFAQLPETIFPTGPQVVSVSPADEEDLLSAMNPAYSASITNGDRTLSAASIQLRLDGTLVTPAPTITSAGGLTNVTHQGTGLLSSGSHLYTLTYSDNLGDSYTNVVQFTANYATIPPSYALPSAAGLTRGFLFRTVLSDVTTNTLDASLARARAQLDGTLINPETNQPYTNSAGLGTNADGTFSIDGILDFNDFGVPTGTFTNNETSFPGLDVGPNNYFATEGTFYLDLPAGYYHFGVNSDDGFSVSAVPPPGVAGAELMLGFFDNGRAPDDTIFDFVVQKSGIYPIKVIYFEATGGASLEFFSLNVTNSLRLLINDPAEANAIKSYRALRPLFSRIARSGANVTLDWAFGTPPFQLQSISNITSTNWVNVGSSTSNRTATVPIQPGNAFFRVQSQ